MKYAVCLPVKWSHISHHDGCQDFINIFFTCIATTPSKYPCKIITSAQRKNSDIWRRLKKSNQKVLITHYNVLPTVLLNNVICAPKKPCPQVILKVWWKAFLFEILIPCKFIKFLLYLYIFAFVMFLTVFEFFDCM